MILSFVLVILTNALTAKSIQICGDGKCSGNETVETCPQDCAKQNLPNLGVNLLLLKTVESFPDPCGPIPPNAIEVSTTADLVSAAKTPGAVIQLAPGNYEPSVGSWETPEYGPFMANLLLRGVTLIGAGEGATTIVLQGGADAALYTYGDATLRNLTIDARYNSQIAALDIGHVTMCKVTVNFSSSHSWGIILNPWHGGSASISMYETTLSHPDGVNKMASGLWLQTCSSADPVTMSAEIHDSHISGWYEGVLYYTGDGSCGSISVNTDCKGFSDNTYNVNEVHCPGGGQPCVANEKCP